MTCLPANQGPHRRHTLPDSEHYSSKLRPRVADSNRFRQHRTRKCDARTTSSQFSGDHVHSIKNLRSISESPVLKLRHGRAGRAERYFPRLVCYEVERLVLSLLAQLSNTNGALTYAALPNKGSHSNEKDLASRALLRTERACLHALSSNGGHALPSSG